MKIKNGEELWKVSLETEGPEDARPPNREDSLRIIVCQGGGECKPEKREERLKDNDLVLLRIVEP